MMRLRAIVALLLVFLGSVSASAQNLVSPKLLPVKPSLRVGIEDFDVAFSKDSRTQTNEGSHRKHWTTGGKVLTFVGAGIATIGTVLMVHGASNPEQLFARDEKFAGIGMLAGGSVTTIIGLTRRSTN